MVDVVDGGEEGLQHKRIVEICLWPQWVELKGEDGQTREV
jgi:hypothetical protein